jgi:hypothetical protein
MKRLHVTEREWDKMLRGELYLASDSELVAARVRARRLWAELNRSDPADDSLRARVLGELLGGIGSRSSIDTGDFGAPGTGGGAKDVDGILRAR